MLRLRNAGAVAFGKTIAGRLRIQFYARGHGDEVEAARQLVYPGSGSPGERGSIRDVLRRCCQVLLRQMLRCGHDWMQSRSLVIYGFT